MVELNEKKLLRQLKGVERWKANDYIGTLWYETGVGKTYAGLLCIINVLKDYPDLDVKILVPSEAILSHWKDALKIHLPSKTNINVYSINALVLSKVTLNTDLLVVDELHEFYTPDRGLIVRLCIAPKRLGLTATYRDKGKEKIISDLFPVVDRVDEAESLKEGYISQFIEFNLPAELNKIEKEQYDEESNLVSKYMSKFGNRRLDLALRCLQGGKDNNGKEYKGIAYCYMWAYKNGWKDGCAEEIDELWNPNKIMGYARNLFAAIERRKQILYNAENKLSITKEVIDKYPKLKAICFSQSTYFAEKLKDILLQGGHACMSYHSNIQTEMLPLGKGGKMIKVGKGRLKKEAIRKIKSGEITQISTASALDRGFDVSDLRLGVSTSGTSNPIRKKQRDGRVKRVDFYEPDAVSILVNVYIKDSQDEVWLRKRQKDSTNTIYWISSVKEITYKPTEAEEDISDLIEPILE